MWVCERALILMFQRFIEDVSSHFMKYSMRFFVAVVFFFYLQVNRYIIYLCSLLSVFLRSHLILYGFIVYALYIIHILYYIHSKWKYVSFTSWHWKIYNDHIVRTRTYTSKLYDCLLETTHRVCPNTDWLLSFLFQMFQLSLYALYVFSNHVNNSNFTPMNVLWWLWFYDVDCFHHPVKLMLVTK